MSMYVRVCIKAFCSLSELRTLQLGYTKRLPLVHVAVRLHESGYRLYTLQLDYTRKRIPLVYIAVRLHTKADTACMHCN